MKYSRPFACLFVVAALAVASGTQVPEAHGAARMARYFFNGYAGNLRIYSYAGWVNDPKQLSGNTWIQSGAVQYPHYRSFQPTGLNFVAPNRVVVHNSGVIVLNAAEKLQPATCTIVATIENGRNTLEATVMSGGAVIFSTKGVVPATGRLQIQPAR